MYILELVFLLLKRALVHGNNHVAASLAYYIIHKKVYIHIEGGILFNGLLMGHCLSVCLICSISFKRPYILSIKLHLFYVWSVLPL